MIKKHEHRKQNRQILKLPKNQKNNNGDGTNSSVSYDSDSSEFDRSTLIKSQKKSKYYVSDSASTGSLAGSATASVTSSKITSLSKVRANQNGYTA